MGGVGNNEKKNTKLWLQGWLWNYHKAKYVQSQPINDTRSIQNASPSGYKLSFRVFFLVHQWVWHTSEAPCWKPYPSIPFYFLVYFCFILENCINNPKYHLKGRDGTVTGRPLVGACLCNLDKNWHLCMLEIIIYWYFIKENVVYKANNNNISLNKNLHHPYTTPRGTCRLHRFVTSRIWRKSVCGSRGTHFWCIRRLHQE